MTNQSFKVLIFIDWYLPGFKAGGPIQSVANIVEHLGDLLELYILTSDTDYSENDPYFNIIPNEWVDVGKAKVMYLPKTYQNCSIFRRIIKEVNPNCIYLNSLFSKYFTLLPIWVCKLFFRRLPILLAPRGMLKTGALSLKKNKKSTFLKLAKWMGWYKNVKWHATSEEEVYEIRNYIGKKPIVANLINFSGNSVKYILYNEKNPGLLKLIYVARIAKVKNLHFALEVLRDVKSKAKIEYDIFGANDEQEYLQLCEQIVKTLPDNVKVNFKGILPPHELKLVWKDYHFLFLPTLGENYGHTIIESLQNGIPVIISDKTIWNGLENANAGCAIALDNKPKYITNIELFANLDNSEYMKMQDNALNYANEKTKNSELIEKYLAFFTT